MTSLVAIPTSLADNGTSVGNPSIWFATETAGATSDWYADFTTSDSGYLTAGTGTITYTGPSGTSFPTDVKDYSINGQAPASVSVTNNSVTMTVGQDISNDSNVSLTISNVTNPAQGALPGTDFKLVTSADTAAVTDQNNETFVAPSPHISSIGFQHLGQAFASGTWELGFTASDIAMPAGGTITVHAPVGTKFPTDPSDYHLGANADQMSFTKSEIAVGSEANSVTITVPDAITGSASVVLNIQETTNPASGNYAENSVSVVTSVDPETPEYLSDGFELTPNPNQPTPPAPTGSFGNVLKSANIDAAGGTVSSTTGNSKLTLDVPKGAFAQPVQLNLTAGSVKNIGTSLPVGQTAVAAFGVNFSANITPSKPITLTIENSSIIAGGQVYKISGHSLVPVNATVTAGKAVIEFSSDPDFVVLTPKANTVLGATSPVTGLPFGRVAAEGTLLACVGGAILLVSRRKNKQR